MPRGRGATRPGRGSVSRDGAHPVNAGQARCVPVHAPKVGVGRLKVKSRRQSLTTTIRPAAGGVSAFETRSTERRHEGPQESHRAQAGAAGKDMPGLRSPLRLAQEMGTRLGRGGLLLAALQVSQSAVGRQAPTLTDNTLRADGPRPDAAGLPGDTGARGSRGRIRLRGASGCGRQPPLPETARDYSVTGWRRRRTSGFGNRRAIVTAWKVSAMRGN